MIDTANWSPWGIRPDYMEGLLNDPNFAARLKDMADIEAAGEMQAAAGRSGANDKGYKILDGVAVIPVTGPLSKRMSFLTWIMGGRTFGQLSEMIYDAVEDPEVDAIVMDVDSPGGTVSGTDAFAEVIAAAAAIKPVVAFANGCMCSAAYWTASATSKVITERTAAVGSIGVIMVHADFSKLDERYGVKYTVLTAGKYKAVGNDVNPLSDEDRAVLQAELDALYAIFVDAVAAHRGVSSDTVRTGMADGRVFIGRAAVDAGLADAVGNLQTAIDAARDMAAQVYAGALALPVNTSSTGATPPEKEQLIMDSKKKMITAPTTVAELEAALPELAQALRDAGAASVDAGPIVRAECERVLGLARIHFGADAGGRFAEIVDSGLTEAQYKAVCGDTNPGLPKAGAIKGKEEILDGLKGSGAANPGADNGAENSDAGGKDFMSLVEEHMAVFKVGKLEALQAVMQKNPKAHAAYLKSVN